MSLKISPNRWFVFVGTFCVLHFAFWLLILVRDLRSTSNYAGGGDGTGILGGILIFVLLGPVTSAAFGVGYAAVDTLVGTYNQQSIRGNRYYDSIIAGFVAYSLMWVVLSYRLVLPQISENLANSYLGFNLGVPWAAILLGSVSAATSVALGIAIDRYLRRLQGGHPA
jgi:hypothetical protein